MQKILMILTSVLFLSSCVIFKHEKKPYAPVMIFVEGGTFTLGDIFDQENTDALPTHKVEISSFYIGKN